MVCQNCVEGETCLDCEKHPGVTHSPPNIGFNTTVQFVPEFRTPNQRIEQLERDVAELKRQIAIILGRDAG